MTDGEEAARPFGEVLARTRAAMERFTRTRAEAERVSVTETSPDGAVTVTVNSGGVLTELRIKEHEETAAAVMSAMRRAQAQLANRMNDVMADMGQDKETVDRVLAVYRDRFPEPESEQSPATDAGDDWDDGGSILKRR